ncbi:ABC transporter ATP-binding protein [Algisphaera agarilytica]|uniref:ATP-binding cassette subfamily B protein n=1 Tax=Algisphaera agarilytica TaxID=1385975 RepID=A0A7X0LJA6_9BACT|nr:ABC transporter ATP-binding protein [Algisphaera agarilytica]MBB6429120.1 ATP-binding cassette subfamily B protein [Algisphaera agarilytica]
MFGRPYLKLFAALAVVAVLVAACEVTMPLLVGAVIDHVTQHGVDSTLWPYAAGFAVLSVVFAGLIFGFIALAGKLSIAICYDIREGSFRHLQELHFGYFDQRPVGWLMARLTSDCNLLSRIMGWSLLDVVWGVCMLAGISVAMLILNWKLALLVLAVVPPLVLVARWFQWRLLGASRKVRKANSHLTAGFNESIQGVRTTKSLVREERNLEEFQQLTDAMYLDSMRNAVYTAAFWPVLLTLCSAATGVVLWYGGLNVLEGTLTVGQLVMFIGLATQFSNPIQEMSRTVTMILSAQASAERIQQVLEVEPAIQDSEEVSRRIETNLDVDSGTADDGLRSTIREVSFQDVEFAYTSDEPILRGCSLTAKAGQTIALVGPTGGGKSTIVSLLCRFYEPQQGDILLDGTEYRDRSLAWYQSQLGIVLQVPQLFNDTIRENIRYGNLDASDEQVVEAAQWVNAHGFIEGLAEGYGTKVGEGGNQLSTGQKQLIALARAVLSDPQVFVMDEATSSVDTETEGLIQAALDRVMEGRIAFVIAHRLSTIKNADQILFIDQGQIVEQGTHQELIARRECYFELYTNQFTEEHEVQVLRS